MGGTKTSQRKVSCPSKKTITHPGQMVEWNSSRLLCIYGDENTVLSREDQCSALPILFERNHFCLEAMNNNLKKALKIGLEPFLFSLLSFFFFFLLFVKIVWETDFYIYVLACCVHTHRRQGIKEARLSPFLT